METSSIDEMIANIEAKMPSVYLDFNNFHLHFIPTGYRQSAKSLGYWHKHIVSPKHYQHSTLATSQTYEEFYQVFDKVVEGVSGLPFSDFLEKVTTVLELRRNPSGFTTKQKQNIPNMFFELLNPIRKRLYALGYNWNDLCR
jgi:hypothetical protein